MDVLYSTGFNPQKMKYFVKKLTLQLKLQRLRPLAGKGPIPALFTVADITNFMYILIPKS